MFRKKRKLFFAEKGLQNSTRQTTTSWVSSYTIQWQECTIFHTLFSTIWLKSHVSLALFYWYVETWEIWRNPIMDHMLYTATDRISLFVITSLCQTFEFHLWRQGMLDFDSACFLFKFHIFFLIFTGLNAAG